MTDHQEPGITEEDTMTMNTQYAKKIEELVLSDDAMTFDCEFFLDRQDDGNDWKAFLWYDKELEQWCEPTFYTAPTGDNNSPWDETEEMPPQQLLEHIAAFIETSNYQDKATAA